MPLHDILDEFVETELVVGIDAVVQRDVRRIEGLLQLVHRVVHQVSGGRDVVLEELEFLEEGLVAGERPLLFLSLQLLKVGHIRTI